MSDPISNMFQWPQPTTNTNPTQQFNFGQPTNNIPSTGGYGDNAMQGFMDSSGMSLPSNAPTQQTDNLNNMAGLGPNNSTSLSQGSNQSFMGGMLGDGENQGWGAPVLGGLSSLAQSWLGFQQLGVAKDQLSFQKDSFKKNYDQQAQSYNTQLADRQRARKGSSINGNYASVGDYMTENGAKQYNG